MAAVESGGCNIAIGTALDHVYGYTGVPRLQRSTRVNLPDARVASAG